MKAVIYARVSSSGRRDTERQAEDLTAYAESHGIEIVTAPFQDYQSGITPNKDRTFLKRCLDYCADRSHGVDCILMSEVSRLGRDPWEMIELVKFFHDNGINVFFLREDLYMYEADGKENPLFSMLFAMFGKFAGTERTDVRERLQSGYRKFRDAGGKVGRKKGCVKSREEKESEYARVLRQLRSGMSIRKTAKLCGVSLSTVMRLKKEFGL